VNFACYYRMSKDCNPETYTRLQKYILNYSARSGNRRNLLVAPQSDVKSLCIHIYHTRMSWIPGHFHTKIKMITDILCMTRKHGSNSIQTSVIFTVSTQCYTKRPYKEGKLPTSPRCCFHCPTMLHPLLGGESLGLFNDASSLLLTDRKKIPALLHQDWVHSLSFPSLQHQS